ncbi:MAG: diguanylate cyclase [Candidatus Sumerlaeaceae bacterium]
MGLLVLLTVRAEFADHAKLREVQWNLYESRNQAANLLIAIQQFERTGNWLVLSAALEHPISKVVSSIHPYVEEKGAKVQRKAYHDLMALANEAETSIAYALALHLRGLELSEQQIPAELRNFRLSESDAASTPVVKLARARELLLDRNLAFSLIRYRSLVDSFTDIVYRDFQERLDRRNRIINACGAGFILILLLGLLLPAYVRALERRAAEFNRTMVELGERMGSLGSLDEAVHVLAKATEKLIGWDAFGVSLYDMQAGEINDLLWIDTFDGKKQEFTETGRPRRPVTPLQRRVLRGESLLFAGPLHQDFPREKIGNKQRVSQSLMFVPIRRGERILGFVTLQSYKPYAYSERSLAFLEWLVARFAGAIERADLIEKYKLSEQRYRQLVETTLDGVFVIDLENVYFVNSAFVRIFGYDSREEIIGKLKLIELVSPVDRELVRKLASERLEGKHPEQTFCWRGLRKDGREIVVESLGTVIEYEGKRRILGTLRDVTQREEARRELEAVHQLYQRAIAAAGAVPYRLNFQTGRFEFPSTAIEELTGFKGEELTWGVFSQQIVATNVIYPSSELEQAQIIRQLEEMLPLEQLEQARELRHLIEGEANLYRAEILFQRKDGRRVWLLNSAVMEEDETGRVVASLGILQDITPTKRLQLQTDVAAQLTRLLASAPSLAEAGKMFVEEARRLFEFDAASVVIYDPVFDRFSTVYAEDTIGGVRQEVKAPEKPSVAARRVLEGRPYLLVRRDPEESAEDHIPFGNTSRRSMSIMAVPLRHGSRVLGMVTLHSYGPHAFDMYDLTDLCALADHFAVILEHIQLFQRLAESEEQLRAVWENAAVGIRLTDSEGIVWLVNPHYCQIVGKNEEELIGKPFSIVYSERERERLMTAYRKRWEEKSFSEEMVRELELWNGQIKILMGTNRFVHTRDGMMLLTFLNDRTREIRLQRELEKKQKELEQLATHDPLTGLKNRRLALQLLEHEIERARRYRLPICVLMIDLDHFKLVNDTYGHLAGDEVLRQFARILEKNSRAVDIVARYGGEEFVVAMPETGLEGALVFAERVRNSVEKHKFDIGQGCCVHITCSIGVTQGELELLEINTLLALADRALYRAKEEGRNRISVA